METMTNIERHPYTQAVLIEWALDDLLESMTKQASKLQQQGLTGEAELLYQAVGLAREYRNSAQASSGFYAQANQNKLTREAMDFIDRLASVM